MELAEAAGYVKIGASRNGIGASCRINEYWRKPEMKIGASREE